MSANFYIVCEETKYVLWIGQGWAEHGMDCFYSGEEKTMDDFHNFLREHENKNIMLRHEFYVHEEDKKYIDYSTKRLIMEPDDAVS